MALSQLNIEQQYKRARATNNNCRSLAAVLSSFLIAFRRERPCVVGRNQGSLEQVLKPFRERLDYFQQRINDLHGQSLQGHSVISEQIKQLLSAGLRIGDGCVALTRIAGIKSLRQLG